MNNLPGTFIDIATPANALDLDDEDETVRTTPIGNLVFPAGNVVIANNGGAAFRNPPSNDLAALNQPIPSLFAFGGGQSLLPYWDDHGNHIGDVYMENRPLDRLIIQWDGNALNPERGINTTRFQLQIFHNAPLILAQFIYDDIEQLPRAGGGVGATIGYQDGPAGFNDVQWSFNQPGAVSNGTVLSLIMPEPATLLLLLGGVGVMMRRRSA